MSDTLFTRIIKRELPADMVYETDDIIAIRDINPQAPTHVLVIPKVEIATVNDIQPGQAELIGEMVLAAQKIALDEGIAEDGYRLVINCNRHGCQEVFHLHMHLVGGRQLRGISAIDRFSQRRLFAVLHLNVENLQVDRRGGVKFASGRSRIGRVGCGSRVGLLSADGG